MTQIHPPDLLVLMMMTRFKCMVNKKTRDSNKLRILMDRKNKKIKT